MINSKLSNIKALYILQASLQTGEVDGLDPTTKGAYIEFVSKQIEAAELEISKILNQASIIVVPKLDIQRKPNQGELDFNTARNYRSELMDPECKACGLRGSHCCTGKRPDTLSQNQAELASTVINISAKLETSLQVLKEKFAQGIREELENWKVSWTSESNSKALVKDYLNKLVRL